MTRKRAAVIGAGIAAGAVAAGAVGTHDRPTQERARPRSRICGTCRPTTWADRVLRRLEDRGRVPSGDPEAPVLLFVHGFSLDMTTWHEQWIDLSADFRCVLMDQRGHGRSGPPAHGNCPCERLGRDIAAVLDVVAPDRPAVVVGHSMGGMAAIALAEQRPELFGPRIAGLILVGCSSSDLVRAALGSVSSLLRPRLGRSVSTARARRPSPQGRVREPRRPSGHAFRLTQFGPDAPAHLVEHVGNLSERASSRGVDRWAVETDGDGSAYALPRVTVPTLVVVGQHDRITPPAASVALAGELPDADARGPGGRRTRRHDGASGRAGSRDPCLQPQAPDRRRARNERPKGRSRSSAHDPDPGTGRRRGLTVHEVPAGRGPDAGGLRRRRLPTPTCCSSARGRASTRTSKASPSWAPPGSCSRRCSEASGWSVEVYIANIVKCRPPGNRDPQPDEIEACTPWLVEQISLIQPRVVVTLGNFATKFVLNTSTGITRLRGQVHDWHGRTVIPTFHPAAILHGGGERSRQFQLLKDDFALVRSTLDDRARPRRRAPRAARSPPATAALNRCCCCPRRRRRRPGSAIASWPETDPAEEQLELF